MYMKTTERANAIRNSVNVRFRSRRLIWDTLLLREASRHLHSKDDFLFGCQRSGDHN